MALEYIQIRSSPELHGLTVIVGTHAVLMSFKFGVQDLVYPDEGDSGWPQNVGLRYCYESVPLQLLMVVPMECR